MDNLQQLINPSPSSDPYQHLGISLNPDGSLTRRPSPVTSPSQDPHSAFPSLSKDVPLNPSLSTSLRLFLPKSATSSPSTKLPVVLFIHGGGFILFRTSTSIFHAACSLRAAHIPALVASLDYRLAPEHRLPAAYDDAAEALGWLRNQAADPRAADPWLRDHADFSRCFLMGSSAGANIAYRLALRLPELNPNPHPLTVRGVILISPYFGGVERTESEARSVEDKTVPLAVNDLMWELSLPVGAGRDHEYCNPLTCTDGVKGLPKCLVKGFVGDPLYDRMRSLVEMLRKEGVEVVERMDDTGFHGVEVADPGKAAAIMEECREFIGAFKS